MQDIEGRVIPVVHNATSIILLHRKLRPSPPDLTFQSEVNIKHLPPIHPDPLIPRDNEIRQTHNPHLPVFLTLHPPFLPPADPLTAHPLPLLRRALPTTFRTDHTRAEQSVLRIVLVEGLKRESHGCSDVVPSMMASGTQGELDPDGEGCEGSVGAKAGVFYALAKLSVG